MRIDELGYVTSSRRNLPVTLYSLTGSSRVRNIRLPKAPHFTVIG